MNVSKKGFSSLEIKANYTCNTRCPYCCARNNWGKPILDYAAIEANIRYFIENYRIEEFCLSGGEPTIHPAFFEILEYARSQGLRTYLHSNGIRFADRGFASRSQALLDRVLVGFSYHEEGMCAALTGVRGSFARRLQGIDNLLVMAIPVRTNTVILRENLQHLPEIAEVVSGLGVRRALLTLPFFISATDQQVGKFVPPEPEELNRQLTKAITILHAAGVSVALQGLPPCKLGEFSALYEIDPDRAFVDSDHQYENHTLLFSGKLGYRQIAACEDCQENGRCWGFPAPMAMGELGDALGLP